MKNNLHRISLFVLTAILATLILPVMAYAVSIYATEYESYNTGGDGDSANISGLNWAAQQFTADNKAHTVNYVRVSLKKVGDPDTVTVSIKPVDDAGKPYGLDIASGTLDGATFSTSYLTIEFEVDEGDIEGGESYAVVVRALAGDATNYVLWQKDTGGGLASSVGLHSTDGGVTWTSDTPADYLFEIWGFEVVKVNGGVVFSGYIEDDDLLFTFDYDCVYPPYYPSETPAKHFDLRLYDTDNVTVIASTPLKSWGEHYPASIYLSADASAPITLGGAYKLALVNSDDTSVNATYTLQGSDWYGDNLVYLDDWVKTLATVMEVQYSTTFLTAVSGKGDVLNEEGGVIFDNGISGLSYVRPDLFKTVSNLPTYTLPEWTNAYDSATDWETEVGAGVAADATTMGNVIGMDGKGVLQILLALLVVVIALFSGYFFYGVILAFPIILWGTEMRVVAFAIVGVLVALALFNFVFRTWWSKT